MVQAVAGRVDHVAGQERAERERFAVGLLAQRAREQPRAVVGGERRHRVGERRARPLDRVAERVERARGQVGERLRGGEVRVVDHDPRAHGRRALVGARGAAVDAGHLGARQRRRDRHRDLRAAAGGRQRLRRVDDAAAAERDDPLARHRAQQLAGQFVDVALAEHVHARRALHHARRHRRRALGGQQRVALAAERLDRVGDRPAPEADRPLSVPPGEAVRHGTLISRCSQAARNGSTIRTSPRSRATSSWRSSVSTARCTVEGPGRLWRLR